VPDFLSAARYTDREKRLPHQDAAWNWAWTLLSKQQQEEFLEMFRAEPPVKGEMGGSQVAGNSWGGIAHAAQRHGAAFPELVAAQWALESGHGMSFSGRNNPFGLKGTGTWKNTTEVLNGKPVAIRAEFKDFESLDAAVKYLVDRWYRDYTSSEGKRWHGVNRAADRKEAARLLVLEGYATDPAYASKLVALMDQHAPLPPPLPAVKPAERTQWVTAIKALNISQPDSRTCQAAAIGMAVGDPDVLGIRRKLDAEAKRQGSSAGSPGVMAAVIRSYRRPYRYEASASLAMCCEWLKAGEFLITHGWFTVSGHVIALDGLKSRDGGKRHDFDVKDPWGEFYAQSWRYRGPEKFFDGFYSDQCIYAACVAGSSAADAARVYLSNTLDLNRGGMWVHRFLVDGG
jgi:hypothetical protein